MIKAGPTDEVRGLKVPFDLGLEGLVRSFEFVSAKAAPKGLFEVTIRRRYLLFFKGSPRTYCGTAFNWRDREGRPPPLIDALFLGRCSLRLVEIGLCRKARKKLYENPLRM